MQCSVLDHFDDALVSSLTGRDDALAMIESLNRFGLFISPLEGETNWYRFHNLFAEFLAHQRQARIPQQEQDLQRAAAKAWLEAAAPHQALRHAHLAQDTELLASILSQYGWKMFNQGELEVLEAAINQLSPPNCTASLNCACCKLGWRRASIDTMMSAHCLPKRRKR